MRKAIVGNKFYEGDPDKLRKQIEDCFLGELGPGEFPCENSQGVKAIISPHAGYFFSGYCAAQAYKALGESRTDDVYLILAPNHSGRGRTSITTQNYETPLGVASINKELAKLLIQEGLTDDIESHFYEHSVEVQLPFLQYVTNNEMTFVPIVVTGEMTSKKLSGIIVSALSQFKKDVKIIVSSDFTHYGEAYGFAPFDEYESQVQIEDMDRKAIDCLIDLNYSEFVDFLEDTHSTICGALPILVLIQVLNQLGKYEGDLLQYYTSAQIVKDKDNSVSYCAISFYEKKENDLEEE